MSYKLTPEERNILLENPDLVMFDPFSAIRTHRCSLGKALVLPVITGLSVFLWAYLCPAFMNAHPGLFAGILCAALILAGGFVPILYFVLDDRAFRTARAEHYAGQLRMLLPEDLDCRIAHVLWVTEEKAEGGWILDGKEEMFGYCSFVNYFRIVPGMDLAVISGGDRFLAFVRPDRKTESLYRNM